MIKASCLLLCVRLLWSLLKLMGRYHQRRRAGTGGAGSETPSLPPDLGLTLDTLTINGATVFVTCTCVDPPYNGIAKLYEVSDPGNPTVAWTDTIVDMDLGSYQWANNALPAGTYKLGVQRDGFAEVFSPEEEW